MTLRTIKKWPSVGCLVLGLNYKTGGPGMWLSQCLPTVRHEDGSLDPQCLSVTLKLGSGWGGIRQLLGTQWLNLGNG